MAKLLLLALTLALAATGSAYAQSIEYFRIQSGTGFFVNRDYLVTNAHVVKGCDKVDIDGAEKQAGLEVTATDEEHDLALVRANAPAYQFAPLRMDIDELKPGDDLTLVGYPGERGAMGEYTVSKAKVEKLDLNDVGKTWQLYISDVIQHGNSGGPVLDASGNVIGVVVGRIHLNIINTLTNKKVAQEKLGVVITLRALQRFVESNGVYTVWNSSGSLFYAQDALIDRAKGYIVHVSCRKQSDKPFPPEPQENEE